MSARLGQPNTGVQGLAFSYDLSAAANVIYVIKRRDNSCRRNSCPQRSGHSHGPITDIGHLNGPGAQGHNQTSLGTSARRYRRRTQTRRHLPAGKTRVTLAQLTAGQNPTPGTYVLEVQGTDTHGQTSNLARIKFWVLTG